MLQNESLPYVFWTPRTLEGFVTSAAGLLVVKNLVEVQGSGETEWP